MKWSRRKCCLGLRRVGWCRIKALGRMIEIEGSAIGSVPIWILTKDTVLAHTHTHTYTSLYTYLFKKTFDEKQYLNLY